MSSAASTGAPVRSLKRTQVRNPTVLFMRLLAALLSGRVLYYVFQAIYGGPSTPSRSAGDDAVAIAGAEAAEDAA